jgi:hypothetical protein
MWIRRHKVIVECFLFARVNAEVVQQIEKFFGIDLPSLRGKIPAGNAGALVSTGHLDGVPIQSDCRVTVEPNPLLEETNFIFHVGNPTAIR